MNDDPTAGAPQGAGQPESLDDTQRVEVPRFAPTPDPRPDAQWAWASPGDPGPSAWQDPATRPSSVPGAAYMSAAGPAGAPGTWGVPPAPAAAPAWAPPAPATSPVTPSRRRSGAGLGTIVTVSVLSAVLASGGTVFVLDQAGAFDDTTPASTVGSGQQTGAQQPVTIDESSAVIDAAAKVGPAVVKIDTVGASADQFSTETSGVGSGVIYDSRGWILTNRHVIADAQQAHRGAQGRPPVPGPRVRHRHPHRPRHRQGRPDRPAGRADRALRRVEGRPAGGRDRQPPRHLLLLGDERDRVGQGPVDRRGRRQAHLEPHPDRRGDQPRQLGRAAASTRPGRSWASTPRWPPTRAGSASPSRSTSPGRSWTRPSPARTSPGRGSASASCRSTSRSSRSGT